jgi:hypothetical protein
MIPEEDLEKAIDRIARTEDGHLFYRWLQLQAMTVVSAPDPSALLVHNGERIFATRLIALMRTGIDESAGRISPDQRPIVILRRPAADNRRTTARERIIAEYGPPGSTGAP